MSKYSRLNEDKFETISLTSLDHHNDKIAASLSTAKAHTSQSIELARDTIIELSNQREIIVRVNGNVNKLNSGLSVSSATLRRIINACKKQKCMYIIIACVLISIAATLFTLKISQR